MSFFSLLFLTCFIFKMGFLKTACRYILLLVSIILSVLNPFTYNEYHYQHD
jgi:hypothetical protein